MKIIIEGAGDVGSHLAKMLSHESYEITVIDDNEARLSKLSQMAHGRFDLFRLRGLAVPLVRTGHEVDSVTHLRLEEDHRRALGGDVFLRLCKGTQDGVEVVAVGDDDVPAEGGPLRVQRFNGGDRGGRTVDLLAVPVGHGDQVAELVVHREHGGFPNLSFLRLAVAAEDVGALMDVNPKAWATLPSAAMTTALSMKNISPMSIVAIARYRV